MPAALVHVVVFVLRCLPCLHLFRSNLTERLLPPVRYSGSSYSYNSSQLQCRRANAGVPRRRTALFMTPFEETVVAAERERERKGSCQSGAVPKVSPRHRIQVWGHICGQRHCALCERAVPDTAATCPKTKRSPASVQVYEILAICFLLQHLPRGTPKRPSFPLSP